MKYIITSICLCYSLLSICQAVEPNQELTRLDSLRAHYLYLKQYDKALDLATKQLSLAEKLFAKNEAEFYSNKISYAYTIKASGEYQKAEKLYLQIIEEMERQELQNTQAYTEILNNTSVLYQDLSQYDKSETFSKKTLSSIEEILGTSCSDYYIALNNYALLQYYRGHYQKAIKLYDEALCIIEDLEGIESQQYAHKLNNKAGAYFRSGDLYTSKNLVLESKRITEKTNGKLSERYLTVLGNLAFFYRTTKEYDKALELLNEYNLINNKLYGNQADKDIEFIRDQANLYQSLNDNEEAYRLINEYIEKSKNKHQALDGEFFMTYFDLASICRGLNKYDEAYSAIQEADKLAQRVHGKNYDQFGMILSLKGDILAKKAKLSEAIEQKLKASEIFLSSTGEKHRDYITNLHELGRLYLLTNQLNKARQNINEAKRLKAKYYGPEALFLIPSDLIEANLFFKEGNKEQAFEMLASCLEERYAYTVKYMSLLSFERRLNLYKDFNLVFDHLLSRFLIEQKPTQDQLKLIIEYNKKVKSLAAKINLASKYQSISSNDPNVSELQYQLSVLNTKINRYISYSNERLVKRKINLDSIIITSKLLEDKLMQKLDIDLTKLTEEEELSQQNVIEFIDFKYRSLQGTNHENRLFALYYKDLENIGFTSISDFERIPKINHLSKGQDFEKISSILFADAKFKTFIQSSDELTIIPSGITYELPYHALKINGHFLSESSKITIHEGYKFKATKNKDNHSLIIGNNYEESIPEQSNDSLAIYVMRGKRLLDSLESFEKLPGVKKEIEIIDSLTSKFKAIKAFNKSEADVKTLLNESKFNLIHIAGHGYFLNNSNEESELKYIMSNSGIAMAEANAFLEDENYSNSEDGLLNAYEIMNLQFQNADLVVLSTCNSAKGEVHNNEGNIGLHLAFKSLGVNNILLTLWEVNDQVTTEFMTLFYAALTDGKSIRSSFDKAVLNLKQKYPPNVWGAYTLYGRGTEILFKKKSFLAIPLALAVVFLCLIMVLRGKSQLKKA